MSYSPNPSKSEFIFGCCGISQLIPMFSMKLLFRELPWGSLRHPNTWDKTSLEGSRPAETASRYTITAEEVLQKIQIWLRKNNVKFFYMMKNIVKWLSLRIKELTPVKIQLAVQVNYIHVSRLYISLIAAHSHSRRELDAILDRKSQAVPISWWPWNDV